MSAGRQRQPFANMRDCSGGGGPNDSLMEGFSTIKNQSREPNVPILEQVSVDRSSSVMLSHDAVQTIKRKMEMVAKELAETDEVGLDEATLLRIFESKTDRILGYSS